MSHIVFLRAQSAATAYSTAVRALRVSSGVCRSNRGMPKVWSCPAIDGSSNSSSVGVGLRRGEMCSSSRAFLWKKARPDPVIKDVIRVSGESIRVFCSAFVLSPRSSQPFDQSHAHARNECKEYETSQHDSHDWNDALRFFQPFLISLIISN